MWTTSNSESWHALFVYSSQEEKIKKAFETTFGDQIKVMIPKRKLRERKEGKWHTVKRKLFPGYVLIKGKIDIETYYRIKEVPMFINLLRDENGPLEIDENELAILNILINNKEGNVGISTAYRENEKIQIVDGPLVGLEGYIKTIDTRKGRAKVKIDFLGEKRIIQLGIEFIDKI